MKNGHCSKKLVDASESLYLSLKKSNYLVEYKKKLFSNLGGWGWTGLQGRISAHQLVMGSLLMTTRNISPKRRLLRGSLPRLRFLQCRIWTNFLNTFDPHTFPRAFTYGTICGDYAAQHTSDLERRPLLLKYDGADDARRWDDPSWTVCGTRQSVIFFAFYSSLVRSKRHRSSRITSLRLTGIIRSLRGVTCCTCGTQAVGRQVRKGCIVVYC